MPELKVDTERHTTQFVLSAPWHRVKHSRMAYQINGGASARGPREQCKLIAFSVLTVLHSLPTDFEISATLTIFQILSDGHWDFCT